MKFLKIICIISFLLIEGMQMHTSINFGIIVVYLYQFLHDIISFQNFNNIFWQGGLLSVFTLGNLILLYRSRSYLDRYTVVFCIISLFFCSIYLDGIDRFSNFNIGFVIPFAIFLLSSILLIILNFKKKVKINVSNNKLGTKAH
ncbi:hypothetical protein NBC122_00946 [Chryseobacterium salivictor]|uniref:Uncharacterized protein n=1 Tax=Chryseobacterium salivictor TaxID=2547600 RepID=A0A4P6ZE13_9FLAO|nr:hypothetical protein NBC122_00946 [Chryseobacterium salivictor]